MHGDKKATKGADENESKTDELHGLKEILSLGPGNLANTSRMHDSLLTGA